MPHGGRKIRRPYKNAVHSLHRGDLGNVGHPLGALDGHHHNNVPVGPGVILRLAQAVAHRPLAARNAPHPAGGGVFAKAHCVLGLLPGGNIGHVHAGRAQIQRPLAPHHVVPGHPHKGRAAGALAGLHGRQGILHIPGAVLHVDDQGVKARLGKDLGAHIAAQLGPRRAHRPPGTQLFTHRPVQQIFSHRASSSF